MTRLAWEKKGLIFQPNNRSAWMHSHAQNPNVLVFDNFTRVFFNCRPDISDNDNQVSYIAYVDFDSEDFTNILKISERPVIELGDAGTFDQHGTMSSSTVWHDNEIWNYYVGWSRGRSVPYNWAIGIAVSKDHGLTFQRLGPGPVIGATIKEPYLQNAPFVLKIDGVWHIWYSSGKGWLEHDGKMESVYQIMHATSMDGIHWDRESSPILESIVENECQTSATLLSLDGRYHLWFSYRYGIDFRNKSRGYRIGYAYSDDLHSWRRDDAGSGIDVSSTGWDSEMICYPHIATIAGNTYMFYCGNHFGRDGFGYAELIVEA
jgi:hypothetical protein